MKEFFKNVFSSVLGVLVGGALLIFLIAFSIIGSLAKESIEEVEVKENSLLHIKINKAIVDRAPKHSDFVDVFQGDNGKLGLHDVLRCIHNAALDPRIKGIFLDFGSISARAATGYEIRQALEAFKASGKFMVAYSENYTQGAYYIASVADEVYIYPQGFVEFKGIGGEVMFYKEMLSKWGVDMQVIRGKNNKFKSAVEPFMLDSMSPSSRKQIMSLLNSMWGDMVAGVSASRGISEEQLNRVADSMFVFLKDGQAALDLNFVDGLKCRSEMIAMLCDKLGVDTDDQINYMTLKNYVKVSDIEMDEDPETPGIGVVFAQGEIESGKGEEFTIGSDRIAGALRVARKDPAIKAIVLRVNSPGGDFLASDVIRKEVELCKVEKPVIVSMGDLAASGGYYISAVADKIYANRTTITGSIGVYSMIPNLESTLEDHLRLNIDRVKTNAHSDLISISRPLTQKEHDVIQEKIEKVYHTFLQTVADGRGMTPEAVNEIGQGRVWSGTDAKRIGLVDELGGLNAAIAGAAQMVNLPEGGYRIVSLPEQKNKLQEILEEITGEDDLISKKMLGEYAVYYNEYKEFRSLLKMKGIQARMPYVIKFR